MKILKSEHLNICPNIPLAAQQPHNKGPIQGGKNNVYEYISILSKL